MLMVMFELVLRVTCHLMLACAKLTKHYRRNDVDFYDCIT